VGEGVELTILSISPALLTMYGVRTWTIARPMGFAEHIKMNNLLYLFVILFLNHNELSIVIHNDE
jgi:hypothetical protein